MQQPHIDPKKLEVIGSHDLREITELLVKHHGIHDGLYDLAIEFQIAVGAVGPDPSSITPGAMIGVRRIGLLQTDKHGPSTVNAAEVNPPLSKKVTAKKVPKM